MENWKQPPDSDNQSTHVNFARSDLALCSTLADLAKNKLRLGEKEDARKLLERAEKIYATIEQFLTHVTSIRAREAIKLELSDRRKTLDSVRQLL